jgi:hypothetical protein
MDQAAITSFSAELHKWWRVLSTGAGSEDPAAIRVYIESIPEHALNHSLQSRFDKMSDFADASCEFKDWGAALNQWTEAMTSMPEPFFAYPSASSGLLIGAAEVLWEAGRSQEALSTLQLSMFVPGTMGTPYAHYLMGRVEHALGNEEKAADELGRAMVLGMLRFCKVHGEVDDVEEEELRRLALRGAASLVKSREVGKLGNQVWGDMDMDPIYA